MFFRVNNSKFSTVFRKSWFSVETYKKDKALIQKDKILNNIFYTLKAFFTKKRGVNKTNKCSLA
jgi:hypothetical protein